MERTTKKIVANAVLLPQVETLLQSGHAVTLRVNGQSMRPFLVHQRDTVCLKPLENHRLRRGMIVLFHYRGRMILHRIRRIQGRRLLIKGDGNYRIVEHATAGDVAGYVSAIGRKGRLIPYRSCRWRWLTACSLAAKLRRTAQKDAKRILYRLICMLR